MPKRNFPEELNLPGGSASNEGSVRPPPGCWASGGGPGEGRPAPLLGTGVRGRLALR